jgi:antitoxin CptB
MSATPPAIDSRRLARLRWRCRRGMLENDLVLQRFLDTRGAAIDESELAMLDTLLALPDNTLWELIAGLAEPEDRSVAPLLRVLRATAPTRPSPQHSEDVR